MARLLQLVDLISSKRRGGIYEKLRQVEKMGRCNMSESNLACASRAVSFPPLTSKAKTDWGHAWRGEFSQLVPPRCWRSIKYHFSRRSENRILPVSVLSESCKRPKRTISSFELATSPSTPKASFLSQRCADGRLVCTSVQLNVGNEPHQLHLHRQPLSHPRRVIHAVFAFPDSQIELPATF